MKRRKVLVVVLALMLVLFAIACNKDKGKEVKSGVESQVENQPTPKNVLGSPREYLPIQVGKVFHYDITLGEVEPLNYREVSWPMGEGGIISSSRGRYLSVLNNPKRKHYVLEYQVKSPAKKQGSLQYPIGFEIAVLSDELGVFADTEKVFIAATENGGLLAYMVATYSPDSPGAPHMGEWGGRGTENGCSMRLFFFGRNPGIQISLGENSQDKLLFVGLRTLPGTSILSLYFIRTVDADKDPQNRDILSKGFVEEMYFVRGVGLARLEQKIQNKTSMIWELKGLEGAQAKKTEI
jgi:hypothetical protein